MRAGSGNTAVEMNSVARRGRHAALRYGRLMTWLVSGVLVIVFASYVALPLGLSLYIPQLAAQHGVRLDVEKVRVEPFRARLLLSGVRIGASGGSSIEWSSIEARVDLAALLSGRLALGSLRLSDAKLLAGEPWAGGAGAIPAIPVAPLEKMSVGDLVVEKVEFVTMSETLGRPVTMDWLRVASLEDAFRPEGAAVQAGVSIGEGRSTLHGRLALNAADWALDAEIRANDVSLDGFPVPGRFDGALRGKLDGSGPVRLVYSPATGAFSATTGGRWAIEGLKIELPDAVISEARADWDGAAFMVFTEDAVETLGIDAELRLRALDIDAGDAFRVEAAELALRVVASQTSATHLSVAGSSPEVRFSGKGSAFEAIDAEATNVVSHAMLTFGNGLAGVEVDRLASDVLTAKFPAGRSIDVERLGIEGIGVDSSTDAVSVAAATAERVKWQGFATAQSSGTAARLAVQGFERRADGEFRFALASAEAIDGRGETPEPWVRGVTLDSATVSPAGVVVIGGVRVSDARFASAAGTVFLEHLSVDGFERDAGGAVSFASGHIRSIDHTHTEARRTTRGSGFELSGVAVSGQVWEAERIRFGHVDVDTGNASYALHQLALDDVTGEEGHGSARVARLGGLEHGFGGNRIVFEELVAASPEWREGEGRAKAVEAASLTLDTVDGHRWRSNGWSLTGAETASLTLPEDKQGTVKLKVPLRDKIDASDFNFGGLVIRGIANTAQGTAEALLKSGQWTLPTFSIP